ncbi:hypothetical protein BH11MYX2_BH11MYX2_41500 [soil metagenome]
MTRAVRFWPLASIALVAVILALRALTVTTPNIASGELHVGRTGPVIVGFQSTKHETLRVAGTQF